MLGKLKKRKSNLPKFKRYQKRAARRKDFRSIKPPSSTSLLYKSGTDESELNKVTDEGIKQLYNLTKKFENYYLFDRR